jgi:putative redox protein
MLCGMLRQAGLTERRAIMLEVSVAHLGSVQFEIRAGRHTIICDQPEDNGGFNEGPTPPELMLASLGSCAAFYAVEYLKRQKLLVEGATRVRVTAEKAKNPARLDPFVIEVEVPTALTDEQRKGMEDAVHRCLIHNTLTHPPSISLAIKTAEVTNS